MVRTPRFAARYRNIEHSNYIKSGPHQRLRLNIISSSTATTVTTTKAAMIPPPRFYPSSYFVYHFWQVPCQLLLGLWRMWLKLHDFHIIFLLCLPPLLFWGFIDQLRHGWPETYASCDWQNPVPGSDPPQNMSSPCPIKKNLFETPTQPASLIAYVLFSLVLGFSLFAYRRRPQSLLKVSFWLQFIVTIAIRCLSSFSDLTTQLSWATLIWNSNSGGKFIWLWILVECPFGNWTYLGFYEDYYYEEGTRTVYDQVGRPVWLFTSENMESEGPEASCHPYGSIFRPWRDIAVRMSYYHLIDNTIHVLWFRYFNTDAPYTTYLNNSELLTMVLFAILVVYTYARMRTHVYFNDDDDERGLLVDIKSPVPTPIHSAWRDLFTFTSSRYDFRTASKTRYVCMAFYFVLATCAAATWHIPGAILFWAGVAEASLCGWVISNRHVEAGDKRLREEGRQKKREGTHEDEGQQRAVPAYNEASLHALIWTLL